MGHYDELNTGNGKKEIEDKKEYIRYSLNKLTHEEIDFLMKIIVSLKNYMSFFESLRSIIQGK